MSIRERLTVLGLANYEAEVYGALVKIHRAKAGELADMVSVPRPQVYLALKKLTSRGMCVEYRGKVNRYSAVSPVVAFRDVLKAEKEKLQAKTKAVKELAEVHRRRKKEMLPTEFFEVLKGRQIREVLERAYRKARNEILVVYKGAVTPDRKEMETTVKQEKALLKKGIRIRCLYEDRYFRNRQFAAYVQKVVQAGEQGRAVKNLPMSMVVVDDNLASFTLAVQEKDVTVFLSRHPSIVTVVRGGFEHIWAEGTDVKDVLKENEGGRNDATGQPAVGLRKRH